MSYLGSILGLQPDARLVGIDLAPVAHDLQACSGWIVLHRVHLPGARSAAEVGRAALTMMPSGLATILGNEPDGTEWFVTFQYADAGHPHKMVRRAADAVTGRAIDLIGLDGARVASRAFTAEALRRAYADASPEPVSDWTVVDLLVGLLLELANFDLADLTAGANNAADNRDIDSTRQIYFDRQFRSWAATYEGPRHD